MKKITAKNNEFLARVKRAMNHKVFAKASEMINSAAGDEIAARQYVAGFFGTVPNFLQGLDETLERMIGLIDNVPSALPPRSRHLTSADQIDVGSTIFFEDAFVASRRHACTFRGWNGADAVIIWKGQQMKMAADRLFAHDVEKQPDQTFGEVLDACQTARGFGKEGAR